MKLDELLNEAVGYKPGIFTYNIPTPDGGEMEVTVEYDYTPETPQSRHGPAQEEEVDITSILDDNGRDITEYIMDDTAHALIRDMLENAALEHEIDVRFDDRY